MRHMLLSTAAGLMLFAGPAAIAEDMKMIGDIEINVTDIAAGMRVSELMDADIKNDEGDTIGEVSELCAVKPHVLRYWEQEFPQLKPIKRRGNRRYYQRQDVLLIRQIRSLLYEQGFTIGGARQRLSGDEVRDDAAMSQQIIRQLRDELEEILDLLH